MNNENAGERVFANVDEALAKKIISRSKKNCGNAAPKIDVVTSNTVMGDPVDKNDNRISRYKSILIITAAAIGALLILAILIFGRKDNGND
ncbi:MAG: hypothetical protein LBU70_06545 [Chitinispirillales bacterium]|jgi:hypothetical protein|nr:hypothetical protein [Chitinispirillales bacterium]